MKLEKEDWFVRLNSVIPFVKEVISSALILTESLHLRTFDSENTITLPIKFSPGCTVLSVRNI